MKRLAAREVLSIRTASTKQNVTRRHHFSERRMPLRQPPAEQPFSLIPPNWNPVSNDRVLLRLEPLDFCFRFVISKRISLDPGSNIDPVTHGPRCGLKQTNHHE
jgi:hypothetical protein